MPTFGEQSTADEVANTFASEVKGKNVLVTGTSINGLGFETARVLAKYGARLIIITGYNAERLQSTEDELRKESPDVNIRQLVLNLSSLADVRKAAAEVNAYSEHIDILINNAASSMCEFKLTPDGFEHQTATDHLGPFLFTALILPKVLAAPSPRVVFVASGAHVACNSINFEEIEHPNAETYHPALMYAQAKCANILTTGELARRAKGKLLAYSIAPGPIVTNFVTNPAAKAILVANNVIFEDGKPNPDKPWKTIPQGAAVIVTAALDPSLNDKSGSYLANCVVNNEGVKPHAADPMQAKKLWELSERLVGVKFL